jgi:hypothetical protein
VQLINLLSGAVTFGFLIASLFFLRFWSRTRDTLFLAFSASFALLGIAQAVIVLANAYLEDSSAAYLVRLAAFAIIIVAIWRKNRRHS